MPQKTQPLSQKTQTILQNFITDINNHEHQYKHKHKHKHNNKHNNKHKHPGRAQRQKIKQKKTYHKKSPKQLQKTKPHYQITIHNIPEIIWTDELYPTLQANKSYLKLKQAQLISEPYHNTQINKAIICGKNIDKLHKTLKPLQTRNILPQKLIYDHISQKEAYRLKSTDKIQNKATITGCTTLTDCSQCETYINTLINPQSTPNWYKHKIDQQWQFELEFENKLEKNKFIQKWIHKRSDQIKHLMIYSKDIMYNKTYSKKKTIQATKQLFNRIKNTIETTQIPENIKQKAIDKIKSILPENTLQIDNPHIPENALDFLQIYNIADNTDSIQTTIKNNKDELQTTRLIIMNNNIGGGLTKKLKTNSNFMYKIITYQPHIIIIQEHMLTKCTTKELEKIAQIPGYTLVAHSKAQKNKNKRARFQRPAHLGQNNPIK